MTHSSGTTSNSEIEDKKNSFDGLPTISALVPLLNSRAERNAPGPSASPSFLL